MLFCVVFTLWEELTLRADEEFFSGTYRYICIQHVLPTDYRHSLKEIRTLKPGTLPSVFYGRNRPLEETDERLQVTQANDDGEGSSFHAAIDIVNNFRSRKS